MPIPEPRSCLTVDEIRVGDCAEKTYRIEAEDAVRFSELSGDWNPAHHDADYAAKSVFKERIAHGIYSVAQFSDLFGMRLPGLGAIWLKESVEFLAPAYFGREYRAVVTVTEVDVAANTVTFLTECFDADDKCILTGESVVKPIPGHLRDKR
ncbi:MAG: MaoC family dehydratase, partial [Gammaproteobacteria bacterium]